MIGSRNVKNASSRLRQKRRCSCRSWWRTSAHSSLSRSARGRSPRATAAAPRAPRARVPRRALGRSARGGASSARPSRRRPRARRAGSGSRSPPRRAGQLRRPAERDDLALAQDGDAVGELLGLVEVVRGQEDGLAELRAASGSCPTRRGGPPGRSRSSARRGRGARGRRRARARGRAAASARPTASSRARPASPRARRGRSPRPSRAGACSSRRTARRARPR